MRIIAYNILDGGVGRADPIAEVIQAQQADLIALIEADDDYVVDRIARRLKMDLIVATGHGKRIALLSRLTIQQTIDHSLVRDQSPRACCEAWVCTPLGVDLPVIGLHLHPRADEEDESIRQHQMQAVMAITHDYRTEKRPHLLIGDFNSNSPHQLINIADCKPATQESHSKNGNALPRRVIQNLLDHGYVDTLQAVTGESATMTSFTTHHPGQRVDYIFAFGIDPSQIKQAWIERDRLAQFASDHYPVGAELNV